MTTPDRPKLLTWQSSELDLVSSCDIRTLYPRVPSIPGLSEEIDRIGGSQLVRGTGYGSAFNGDATKTSLMDILMIVRNSWAFYNEVAKLEEVELGTTRTPGFHAEFNLEKGNFYQATLYLIGKVQKAKLWVIPVDEFVKHAHGGRPNVPEGKGGLYLAGRMHKAMFPVFVDHATEEETEKIDTSFNRARIDGVWLALGLLSRYFTYDELAEKYVNLSYAADKRVEKADKSQTLLEKNREYYEQMLHPILSCFEEKGIIESVEGKDDLFMKQMSLQEAEVKRWLKQSAQRAFWVNFSQNPLTFGPLRGLGYGLAKVRRSRS